MKGAMMKPKQATKTEADKLVRDIKRATRRKFSAEEKIRIAPTELPSLAGQTVVVTLDPANEIREKNEENNQLFLRLVGPWLRCHPPY